MRIDLFTAAQATEPTTQSAKLSGDNARNQAASRKSVTEDTTSLSSSSDSVASLTHTALQASSSRADKVALLKQAVGSGQYQLDSTKIAEAIANSDL